jgi:hypothetical protein
MRRRSSTLSLERSTAHLGISSGGTAILLSAIDQRTVGHICATCGKRIAAASMPALCPGCHTLSASVPVWRPFSGLGEFRATLEGRYAAAGESSSEHALDAEALLDDLMDALPAPPREPALPA